MNIHFVSIYHMHSIFWVIYLLRIDEINESIGKSVTIWKESPKKQSKWEHATTLPLPSILAKSKQYYFDFAQTKYTLLNASEWCSDAPNTLDNNSTTHRYSNTLSCGHECVCIILRSFRGIPILEYLKLCLLTKAKEAHAQCMESFPKRQKSLDMTWIFICF